MIVELVTNRPHDRLAPGRVLSSAAGDLAVMAARPHQGRWIVAFEGVADRDAAERLRDRRLSAEPLEEEGTLWVHELVGSQVVDTVGRGYGPVEAVEANPASDLLVLQGDHLVPLIFVVERTTDARVVIEPPPGLFEEWDEVFLVPADPSWPARFAAGAERLRAALGPTVAVEHHGSTAVPGLAARPVVDILVGVPSRQPMAPYREALERLGYVGVDDPSGAGVPSFGWPADRPHLFHVRVVEAGGAEERRQLAVRNRLRSDPAAAAAYAEAKGRLARRFPHDGRAYAAAKSDLLGELERQPRG